MSLILKNIDTVNVEINDLGITLIPGQELDLAELKAHNVAASTDIVERITGGSPGGVSQLRILDPLNDTTILSAARSVEALQAHNDSHFRVGKASELDQLEDVTITKTGSPPAPETGNLLRYNGSQWVNVTSNIVAGDISHGDLLDLDQDDHPQYVLDAGDTMTGDLRMDNASEVQIISPFDAASPPRYWGLGYDTPTTSPSIFRSDNGGAMILVPQAVFPQWIFGSNAAGTIATYIDCDNDGDLRLNTLHVGPVTLGPGGLRLQQTGGGGEYISFIAPALTGSPASYTLTLPPVQGGVDTVLVNDGSGNLAWEEVSAIGGGILGLGEWELESNTSPPPDDEKMRFNNATPTSATKLYIDYNNDNGDDVTNFLQNVQAGSYIYAQKREDSSRGFVARVTGVTSQTTYVEYDVADVTSLGGSIQTGKKYALFVVVGTGAAGTDELVKVSADDTTADYLGNKVAAGLGISVTEITGSPNNETLEVALNADLGDLNDVTYTGSPAPADGDVLVYNSTGSPLGWTNIDPGSLFGTADDLAVVQVRRSTNLAVPTSYADIAFDTTDVENQPDILEHNNTNTDNIDIKEDGLYMITYQLSIDADAGEESFDIRVRLNDTSVIAGSERLISEDDEINDAGNVFFVELSAGDFITYQVQGSGTGNVLLAESTYTIARMRGTKGADGADGAQGPAGSGSNVNVKEDGVLVTGTPFDTLNFEGMEATGDGSPSEVSIKNVFGSEFQTAADATVSTTTSTTFQNKLTLNTTTLPAGTYRVAFSYGWNHNATDTDFEAQYLEDASSMGEIHKQEPKDSAGSFSTTGTSQRYYVQRVFYTTFVTAATHTYQLQYRTDSAGDESSVWDCIIELWRVS